MLTNKFSEVGIGFGGWELEHRPILAQAGPLEFLGPVYGLHRDTGALGVASTRV